MIRAMDRIVGSRTVLTLSGEHTAAARESPEVGCAGRSPTTTR